MGRVTLGVLLLVIGIGTAASSAVAARQNGQVPNVPGMPTEARTIVTNGRQQPVPVVLGAGGEMQPVTIVGTPSVVVAGDSVVAARLTRQTWEYRSVVAAADDDVAAALAASGGEGWEAVGLIGGPSGSTRILLKRPR
jgi:hypothetical protein